MKRFAWLVICATLVCGQIEKDVPDKNENIKYITTADVMKRIYHNCLQIGSFACVKPKVLSYLSSALKEDKIMITRDLSIVRNVKRQDDESAIPTADDFKERQETMRTLMLDRIDEFLNSHELKVRVPKEILKGEMLPYIPKFLVKNLPEEVSIPLSDTNDVSQGRGFVKKVLIPFLLGLKFKATALIPLAIALIALKTWKALTLGLISMVLSGALVIFRFTKPKVVNYEVYHYPSHPPAPPIEHGYTDHHGYGRSVDDIVYRGQLQNKKGSS